jgi:hypothetical protein
MSLIPSGFFSFDPFADFEALLGRRGGPASGSSSSLVAHMSPLTTTSLRCNLAEVGARGRGDRGVCICPVWVCVLIRIWRCGCVWGRALSVGVRLVSGWVVRVALLCFVCSSVRGVLTWSVGPLALRARLLVCRQSIGGCVCGMGGGCMWGA